MRIDFFDKSPLGFCERSSHRTLYLRNGSNTAYVGGTYTFTVDSLMMCSRHFIPEPELPIYHDERTLSFSMTTTDGVVSIWNDKHRIEPNLVKTHVISIEGENYYYHDSNIKDFILLDKALHGSDEDKLRFLESQGVYYLDIKAKRIDFTYPMDPVGASQRYHMFEEIANEFDSSLHSSLDENLVSKTITYLYNHPRRYKLSNDLLTEITNLKEFYELVKKETEKAKLDNTQLNNAQKYEKRCKEKLYFLEHTILEYTHEYITSYVNLYKDKFESQLRAIKLVKKWIGHDDYEFLKTYGYIDVPSQIYMNHNYRIFVNSGRKVMITNSRGGTADEMCIIGSLCPDLDIFLSKYLMAKDDELNFTLTGSHVNFEYEFPNWSKLRHVPQRFRDQYEKQKDIKSEEERAYRQRERDRQSDWVMFGRFRVDREFYRHHDEYFTTGH